MLSSKTPRIVSRQIAQMAFMSPKLLSNTTKLQRRWKICFQKLELCVSTNIENLIQCASFSCHNASAFYLKGKGGKPQAKYLKLKFKWSSDCYIWYKLRVVWFISKISSSQTTLVPEENNRMKFMHLKRTIVDTVNKHLLLQNER